jgi:integrase
MCFLDAAQVEALAEAIDPRYSTLIRFGAYSGLRASELTALKLVRLDLLRATVRVVEAATEVDGHLHWGGVKTHEARTVRLPRSVADDLGGHLAGHPQRTRGSGVAGAIGRADALVEVDQTVLQAGRAPGRPA